MLEPLPTVNDPSAWWPWGGYITNFNEKFQDNPKTLIDQLDKKTQGEMQLELIAVHWDKMTDVRGDSGTKWFGQPWGVAWSGKV